ncbi:MAG: DNA primase [Gammaproteobacteria bacterium]|nr:DNA primase [Gammaproteobacteria bacterium]
MAGRIPQAFIDDLLSRVDIVDIVEERLELRRSGQNYSACCPFHNEKTPSFTVSRDKQFYHCFGCSAHGSAIGFLMEFDRMAFPEAIAELAQRVGMEVPVEQRGVDSSAQHHDLYELMERSAKFYQSQLREHPQAEQAVDYLKQRGLSGEIAAQFSIGFAPPGWDNLTKGLACSAEQIKKLHTAGMVVDKEGGGYYDRFRHRIMFPIRDLRGRVIGFGGRVMGDETPKYLNSPETPLFHKGRGLFGLYEARKAQRDIRRLLVVEGYMDVVALAQHGIHYAVATLGTATTPEHLRALFRTTAEVVFCFDGDRAGRQAAWKAMEVALSLIYEGRQVSFMFLPDGEDPDSLVRTQGGERFERGLNDALPLSEFFFEGYLNKVDISAIDGRARLVALAQQPLKKLPDSVFKQMMLAKLAEHAQMDVQLLSQSLPDEKSVGGRGAASRARGLAQGRTPISLVRLAIMWLLQDPALVRAAGEWQCIKELDLPGCALLCELLELLRDNPNLSTGAVLERWRGSDEGRYLATLVQSQHPVPVDGIEAEFSAVMSRLHEARTKQRVEQLLQRASVEKLDDLEKLELRRLLSRE